MNIKRQYDMPLMPSLKNRMAMLNMKPTYKKPKTNVPTNIKKLSNRKANYAKSACRGKIGTNYNNCVKNITGNVKKPLTGLVGNRKHMLAKEACKYDKNMTRCINNFLSKPTYPMHLTQKRPNNKVRRPRSINFNDIMNNLKNGGSLGLRKMKNKSRTNRSTMPKVKLMNNRNLNAARRLI